MPPTRYRTGTAQTVLLGLVFFCVPGMWNSITSMAGGLGDARTSSMATAATYALYAVASLVAPSICTSLGARATLFLGSLGYSVYVASLLLYHLGVVPSALVVAAGALNGVCAGLLWVANGVLLYTYAGVDGRGFLFGVFWVVFNLGAVVGGVLSFAENFEHTGAKASTSTFATFLSLMVLGALLTFALAPPGRVVRADGSAAPTQPPIPLRAELVEMGALLVDRRTVALAPLFLFSNWFYAFQFTCFNARLFDARSQGLNNAVYWGMQMGGALLFGRWLDAASVAPRRRAFKALAALSALVALTWSLALWVAASYGLDGAATAQPTLDAIDDPGEWALPFAIYAGWGAIDAFLQTFSFWIIGQLDDDPRLLGRFTGVYRCLQSAGAAVSWALSTYSWGCDGACAGAVPPTAQAWVNVALGVASLPGALWLATTLGAEPRRCAPLADGDGSRDGSGEA